MSKLKGLDKMVRVCKQMQEHKGYYYRKWQRQMKKALPIAVARMRQGTEKYEAVMKDRFK